MEGEIKMCNPKTGGLYAGRTCPSAWDNDEDRIQAERHQTDLEKDMWIITIIFILAMILLLI